MHDFDRIDSDLHSDTKIITLPHQLTELCHVQTPRGKKTRSLKIAEH